MKLLPCLKFVLLAIHVAASGAACFMADFALRTALAYFHVRARQARSLQFALLMLMALGVLAATVFMDKKFSRIKSAAALLNKAFGVLSVQLLVLGALALVPAMAWQINWLIPVVSFAAGAAWFIGRACFYVRKRQAVMRNNRNF